MKVEQELIFDSLDLDGVKYRLNVPVFISRYPTYIYIEGTLGGMPIKLRYETLTKTTVFTKLLHRFNLCLKPGNVIAIKQLKDLKVIQ